MKGMRKTVFDLSVPVELATSGKSSLLIPDLMLGFFYDRCSACGGRSDYFGWMVQQLVPRLPEVRLKLNAVRDPNWNKPYQTSGQDLQKKSFYPIGSDWEFFRMAANSCGVSMCFLFVFLMLLDAENFFNTSPENETVGRNSSPERPDFSERLIKFGKFECWLDEKHPELHRRLQLRV